MTDIICNSTMTASTRIVLLYLATIKDYSGKVDDLAKEVSLSDGTVYTALRILDKQGFIDYSKIRHPVRKICQGVKIHYLGKP